MIKNTGAWIIDTIGKEQFEAAKMRSMVMAALQSYRIENGLTQADLAKAFGITQGMISRWENCEENLTLDTVAKIAAVTGRSIHFSLQKSA